MFERVMKSILIYPYSLKKQPRQKVIFVNEMAITMEDDKTVSSSTSSKSLNTTEKKTFRQTSAKDVVDPKTARMTSLSSTKTQANSSKMRPPGTSFGKVVRYCDIYHKVLCIPQYSNFHSKMRVCKWGGSSVHYVSK